MQLAAGGAGPALRASFPSPPRRCGQRSLKDQVINLPVFGGDDTRLLAHLGMVSPE